MTEEKLRAHRQSLNDHEAMADAQAGCVPCKLCGGKAVITDAGVGAGYYIACENSGAFRVAQGCMITERRLGGWAYNVMDWWNRLHSFPTPAADEVEAEVLDLLFQIDNVDPAEIAKSPSYIKETARAAIAAMQARSADLEANLSAAPEDLIAQAKPLDLPAEPAGEEPDCATCRGYRYVVMAPSAVSAGGEHRPCPVCNGAVTFGNATPTNPERLVGDMAASLLELVAAMRKYEMDVDGDPPELHRMMMRRDERLIALSAAPLKEGE